MNASAILNHHTYATPHQLHHQGKLLRFVTNHRWSCHRSPVQGKLLDQYGAESSNAVDNRESEGVNKLTCIACWLHRRLDSDECRYLLQSSSYQAITNARLACDRRLE